MGNDIGLLSSCPNIESPMIVGKNFLADTFFIAVFADIKNAVAAKYVIEHGPVEVGSYES